MKEEKELVINELKKMSETREDFYRYLDENISKDKNSIYKFENTTCKPTIDFEKLFKKYRK